MQEISIQGLRAPKRGLWARSLYKLFARGPLESLKRIPPQGLYKRSLGKVAVGDLCKSSRKEISQRFPYKTSARPSDLQKDSVQALYKGSLSKISVRDLLARSLQEISCSPRSPKISVRVCHERPPYKIFVQEVSVRDLLVRSLQETSWQDLCKRCLRKVFVKDPCTRSLYIQDLLVKTSVQDLLD